jgi:hypothetical protein
MDEISPPNKIILLKFIIDKLVLKPLTCVDQKLTDMFKTAYHLSLPPAGYVHPKM